LSISRGQDIRAVIKPTRWAGPERLQGTLVSLPASPFPHGHHLIRRPTHADTLLRRLGAQVPRAAARRFHQIAWPGFAVLVATGIWNIAARQDEITGSYRTTPVAKLAAVLASGITAFLTARSHRTARLAVFGAVTRASALAALFLRVLLGG
jgi:hypothetical protein